MDEKKTSFLRDNGFECVPWHRQEDIYFALQTSFVVKRIFTIPDVTYYWVQIDGSCVHSEVTEWHLKQYYDIFDHCINLCERKMENGKTVKSAALVPMQTYALQKKNGEIIVVYAEPATDDRQIFHRFSVPDGLRISIGRSLAESPTATVRVIGMSRCAAARRMPTALEQPGTVQSANVSH